MSRRIAWVSSEGLMDTDVYIVPLLAQRYSIDWYVVRREGRSLDFDKELDALRESCHVMDHVVGRRMRSPATFFRIRKLAQTLRQGGYDAVYIEFGMLPYFIPIMAHILDRDKTYLAIHNVHIVKGGNNPWIASIFTRYAIRAFRKFNVFSQSQRDLLKQMAPGKAVFYTPFLLKDYGRAVRPRRDQRITFISFGNILPYKRVDVLIRAAERIYDRAGEPFRVIIAGGCRNWEDYQALIRHKEMFELRIQRIPNEDIPALFEEADYFVAPYQDIAQSGATMVAMNYDKPIIASNLEAFRECVADGYNGFLIRPADEKDLAETMLAVLRKHHSDYCRLVKNQQEYKKKYSEESIVHAYMEMFGQD